MGRLSGRTIRLTEPTAYGHLLSLGHGPVLDLRLAGSHRRPFRLAEPGRDTAGRGTGEVGNAKQPRRQDCGEVSDTPHSFTAGPLGQGVNDDLWILTMLFPRAQRLQRRLEDGSSARRGLGFAGHLIGHQSLEQPLARTVPWRTFSAPVKVASD
jgi:hypothetical protein